MRKLLQFYYISVLRLTCIAGIGVTIWYFSKLPGRFADGQDETVPALVCFLGLLIGSCLLVPALTPDFMGRPRRLLHLLSVIFLVPIVQGLFLIALAMGFGPEYFSQFAGQDAEALMATYEDIWFGSILFYCNIAIMIQFWVGIILCIWSVPRDFGSSHVSTYTPPPQDAVDLKALRQSRNQ